MTGDVSVTGAVAFVVGALLLLWTGRSRSRDQHSTRVLAWLLLALATAFLLLLYFPNSQASGSVLGFSVTGAVAAFFAVWLYGVKESRKGAELDTLQSALEHRTREVEHLSLRLEQAERDGAGPPPLAAGGRYAYKVKVGRKYRRLPAAKTRQLVLATGDITRVRNVGIWVNSENTNMQMSRFYERTVSATIRFHASRRHPSTNEVLSDDVAEALLTRLHELGTATVAPATVLVTDSGQLKETHNVRHLLHVAAVSGEPTAGYRPVQDLGACVRAVLDKANELAVDRGCDAVILPLLGTGSGGGDLDDTVHVLLGSAVEWLASTPKVRLRTVHFLAYRDLELRSCRHVLEGMVGVRPA